MGNTTYLVGVDIGGTSVSVAIAPTNNVQSMQKLKQDTVKTDAEAISRQVITMIEELVTKMMVNRQDIKAIGIATAGPIDAEKGEVFNNANLGFIILGSISKRNFIGRVNKGCVPCVLFITGG